MSMVHSVAATTASRVYLALVGLVVLPLYLQRLGAEVFGLVAVFLALQVWFQLLDMGLTATLARETARHRAGARSAADLRGLVRSLEGVFLIAASVAATAIFFGAPWIADHWLILQGVSARQAAQAVELMSLCLAVRLLGELYRGALAGFERQVWLAGNGAAFGTLRLLGVIPFLDLVGATPVAYFGYQLAVGTVETLVLLTSAYRLLPSSSSDSLGWSLKPLRGVLGFSLAMAAAGVVWAGVSQVDKLLLSGMLPLAEYGAFAMAVAAAAGVLLATGSLADVLIPRLTRLQAQGGSEAVAGIYREASRWTAVIACSAAAVLAIHSRRVLWVWTGDEALAGSTGAVLALYAVGNAAMAVSAMPYYLQLAQGRLRLHLLGTGLMLVVLVPSLLWAAARWGAVGAAVAWCATNVLYLLAWPPVAHRHFAPGLHGRWLSADIAPVVLATAAAGWLTLALPWPSTRTGVGMMLLLAAAVVLSAGVGASAAARRGLLRTQARWA